MLLLDADSGEDPTQGIGNPPALSIQTDASRMLGTITNAHARTLTNVCKARREAARMLSMRIAKHGLLLELSRKALSESAGRRWKALEDSRRRLPG